MESNWIPVADRLPEVNEGKEYTREMLVTLQSDRYGLCVSTSSYALDYGWWDIESNEAQVIAWQPKPEPYKEGDKQKPQTNGDRIRNMTDEELAFFLCKVKEDYQWVDHRYPSEDAAGDWEEWLQKESEE